MFQAVEINGEAYWDGGYMGNPALFPLIYECKSTDVLIVQINPLSRTEVAKSAQDILDRIDEISFNSSLMRKMRAVAFVTKSMDDGTIPAGKMKRMLIHSIFADGFMQSLGTTPKFNADWEFLSHLKEIGRKQAGDWLEQNYDRLGVESAVDLGIYL
jgi:NTE family protein